MVHNGVRLTARQRRALIFAVAQGIHANPDKRPAILETTVRALAAMELLHLQTSRKGRALWRPTDTGRGLVAATGLTANLLTRTSVPAYTTSTAFAMVGEPEAIV